MIENALLINNKELTQGLDRTIEKHINNITRLINSQTQPLINEIMTLGKAHQDLKTDVEGIETDMKVHKRTLRAYVAAAVIIVGILQFFFNILLDHHSH